MKEVSRWSRSWRRGEGTIVIDFTLTLTHFLTDLSELLKVYEIKIPTKNCRIQTVRASWKPIGKNLKPKVTRKHIHFIFGVFILVPRGSLWSRGRRNRGSARPRGVLPYMGYIGMCGPKGYGFSAVFVINIDFSHFAAILVIKRVAIFAL